MKSKNARDQFKILISVSFTKIQPHETKAWKLTLEHRKVTEAAKIEAKKKEEADILEKKEKLKVDFVPFTILLVFESHTNEKKIWIRKLQRK